MSLVFVSCRYLSVNYVHTVCRRRELTAYVPAFQELGMETPQNILNKPLSTNLEQSKLIPVFPGAVCTFLVRVGLSLAKTLDLF